MKIPGFIRTSCKFEGKETYDGGFVNLRPIFRDAIRPQIVVDLGEFQQVSTMLSCEFDFFEVLFHPMHDAAFQFLKSGMSSSIYSWVLPDAQLTIYEKSTLTTLLGLSAIAVLLMLCMKWPNRILAYVPRRLLCHRTI